MGIYDGKAADQGQGAGFQPKSALLVVGIIVLVIIAFFIGNFLIGFFSEKPLALSLAKNEISSSEQTVLYVTVANTGTESLKTISVSANAVDQQAISVTASGTNKLSILGKGEKRTFEFLVNPLASCAGCNVLPGNYMINVRVTAAGIEYSSGSITLKIK